MLCSEFCHKFTAIRCCLSTCRSFTFRKYFDQHSIANPQRNRPGRGKRRRKSGSFSTAYI